VIVTASVHRLRAIVVLGRQRQKSSYNRYSPYNTPPTPRGRSDNSNNIDSTENGLYPSKQQFGRMKYINTPIDEKLLFGERGRSEDSPEDFDILPMESATELIPVTGRSAV